MDSSKFSCAKQFEMIASTNSTVIMEPHDDLVTVTSIDGADVPVNASNSDISSPLEQQVCADSCDGADNDPLAESSDDAMTGFSLMSQEVQRDGTIAKVMGAALQYFSI